MTFSEVLQKALPADEWERVNSMPEGLLANLYSDYYLYGPNGAAVVQFIRDANAQLRKGPLPALYGAEFSIHYLTRVSEHLMLRMPHDLRNDTDRAHAQARSRDEQLDALMRAVIFTLTAPACMGIKGEEWQTHHEKRYLTFMNIFGLDPETYRYKGRTVNWSDYPVWVPGGPN